MSPCSLTSSSAGPPHCNVFRGQRGIVPATRPVFAHDRHRRRRRMSMHLFLKAHLAGSPPRCSQRPASHLRFGTPTLLAFLRGPLSGTRRCPAYISELPFRRGVAAGSVSGSSRDIPCVDRGDIARGGRQGEGELFPLPLSLTLQTLCFTLPPPRPPLPGGIPVQLQMSPFLPRRWKISPGSHGGGTARRLSGKQAVPGRRYRQPIRQAGGKAHQVLPDLLNTDRGDILQGGDRLGERVPSSSLTPSTIL